MTNNKFCIIFRHYGLALLLAACCTPPAQAESRVALVIGNSKYADSPLKNPVNDAQAMASTLRELGFEVTEKTDLTQQQMNDAIRAFGDTLDKNSVGLFYFSGHGTQVNGENYLLPIGSDIQREDEVAFQSVNAQQVLTKMESARNGMNILILDACRSNRFARSFKSTTKGLARMDAPTGTVIVYATAPGDVAWDGTGENGLFTSHLLKHITTHGIDISEALRLTRVGVLEESKAQGKSQVPWESSSLLDPFCFAGCEGSQATQEKPESIASDETSDEVIVKENGKKIGQYNKSSGQGTVTFANGNRYEGQFKDGKRTGQGVYTWANGDRYEGQWEDNERTGQGVYTWANGNRYEGQFKDGKRTGQGVYTWANGDRYEGQFEDGKRTGQGVYTWANGDRYEGQFQDGKIHGLGVKIFTDGRRLKGQFEYGKFVNSSHKQAKQNTDEIDEQVRQTKELLSQVEAVSRQVEQANALTEQTMRMMNGSTRPYGY